MATGRRRILIPLLVGALLAGTLTGVALLWSGKRPAAPEPPVSPLPEPGIAQLPARAVEARLGSFSTAEARAFALLGELDDRRIAKMPALDAETLAALPRARDLLGHQRQLPGGGAPTRAPGGSMSITSPGQAPTPAAGAAAPTDVGVAVASRDHGADVRATTTAAGTDPVVATGVEHGLDHQAPRGGMSITDHGQEITGAGTWAALRYVPGKDPEPVISDHGQGGYAIALFPDDTGTTRLNGGLVVPGRFYQVTGDMHVTGSAPIDVHVRPLSAVPTYAPVPCLPPAANG